jgi:hypothetical protein
MGPGLLTSMYADEGFPSGFRSQRRNGFGSSGVGAPSYLLHEDFVANDGTDIVCS